MGWTPRDSSREILDRAMEHIVSVPYDVSARWLFYRLLQDALYHDKADYHGKFLPLTAKARKQFWGGWAPDTLADDTRGVIPGGLGWDTPTEWLAAIRDHEQYCKDKWAVQSWYMECWFEAKAMRGQFEYYTDEIPLLPFGGDISIPAKWETAARLSGAARRYGLPVVVLYFGDDDPKGQLIPESAMADIRSWCPADFTFRRVGLNPGDGQRLGIPENPEKPGTYQWEALDDAQAGQLITSAVADYYDEDALVELRAREDAVTEKFRKAFGWVTYLLRDV